MSKENRPKKSRQKKRSGPSPEPQPRLQPSQEKPKGPKHPSSITLDLIHLVIKIAMVIAIFWLVFHYIFGIHRYLSKNMTPSMMDGDLVFYFRLDKNYAAGDVVVMEYGGETIEARVAAVAGDTVDIDENGLVVNGYHIQEQHQFYETTMFQEGITFPVTVTEGYIFVLGDNRPEATDSRIFGPVRTKDTDGKVIGLLRRRSL